MKAEKIILLDVHIEGMKKKLQDFKWNVVTVMDIFGPTEKYREDDKIIDYAKNNRKTVVITQDQGLIERCMDLGIDVVPIDMDDLAEIANDELSKRFEKF